MYRLLLLLPLVGSIWIEGPKGTCGQTHTDLDFVACQGLVDYTDQVIEKFGETQLIEAGPVNLTIQYPKFGRAVVIKYLLFEYEFFDGNGTLRLVDGGVGDKKAVFVMDSKNCSGYAYNVEIYQIKQ